MSDWSPTTYLRFVGAVVACLLVFAAVGWALAGGRGEGWLPAVLGACVATGAAAAVSGLVLARRPRDPQAALNGFLIAMGVRLAVVFALAALALLVLGLDRQPFLIWLVVSYLALLAVDCLFTVAALRGL